MSTFIEEDNTKRTFVSSKLDQQHQQQAPASKRKHNLNEEISEYIPRIEVPFTRGIVVIYNQID